MLHPPSDPSPPDPKGSHAPTEAPRTGRGEFLDPAPSPDPGDPPRARRDPARPRAHPGDPCRNCGDPTPGEYCRACGQRKVEVRASLRELASDFFEDQFGVERRTPATVFALLFRPGHLTREYLDGRVVRYLRPLKLYLVSSVVLFLLVGILSARGIDAIDFGGGDAAGGGVQTEQDASPETALDPRADRAVLASEVPAGVLRELEEAGFPGSSRIQIGDPRPVDNRPWYERAEINTGSARVNALIEARVRRLGQMEPAEAVRQVLRTLVGNVPTLMFLLLPVFAGLLKLLYLRSGRYYAEHVIFVLHAHAFVFGIFTVLLLAGLVGAGFLAPFLLLWAAIYLYLALRRVYGESRRRTALKYWALGWGYFWVLVVAFPPLLLLSLLLGG